MRVPSLDKIARQCAAYARRNQEPLSLEWKAQFNELNETHRLLCLRFDREVLKHCDTTKGTPCNCQSHPLAKELRESAAKVNTMSHEQMNRYRDQYAIAYKALTTMREAKLKYLQTH